MPVISDTFETVFSIVQKLSELPIEAKKVYVSLKSLCNRFYIVEFFNFGYKVYRTYYF